MSPPHERPVVISRAFVFLLHKHFINKKKIFLRRFQLRSKFSPFFFGFISNGPYTPPLPLPLPTYPPIPHTAPIIPPYVHPMEKAAGRGEAKISASMLLRLRRCLECRRRWSTVVRRRRTSERRYVWTGCGSDSL
jgi:hypothetical protein